MRSTLVLVLALGAALAVPVEHPTGPSVLDVPQDAHRAMAATTDHVTWTYGRSVQGRLLRVTRVGPAEATHRTLVVGCLHGNECDGVPVLDRLADTAPPPDTAYWLVRHVNPDGARRGTRQNARGVDLNRNWDQRWKPRGVRGSTFHAGPRPMSEPETRATARLIRRIAPTFAVWYHQRMDLVDFCGGSRAVGRTYARTAKQRFTRITHYGGTSTLWMHERWPRTTVLTVELPDRVTAKDVARHARAVRVASGTDGGAGATSA